MALAGNILNELHGIVRLPGLQGGDYLEHVSDAYNVLFDHGNLSKRQPSSEGTPHDLWDGAACIPYLEWLLAHNFHI